MTWRLFGAIVAAALSLALAKAWLAGSEEAPAPGASVSFDQLYPQETEAALKARAQAEK